MDRTITGNATVDVAKLRNYHRNPRKGDIDAIERSLQSLGQYRPIVVNKGTHTGRANEVLAGNHTLIAARNLGWKRIDVTWIDVDEDQARRVVLADNRTAELGTYDDKQLLDLIEQLSDPIDVGFDDASLDELRERLALPDFDPDDDDQPRLDRKSVTDCPACGHTFTPETRSVIVDD